MDTVGEADIEPIVSVQPRANVQHKTLLEGVAIGLYEYIGICSYGFMAMAYRVVAHKVMAYIFMALLEELAIGTPPAQSFADDMLVVRL